MYLSDYHTHSRLSFDAHAPLSELAEAAADAGLDELCVTDHFDFLDENGVPAEGYDWAPAVAQHQQALPAAGERLTLKLGLELAACPILIRPPLRPSAPARRPTSSWARSTTSRRKGRHRPVLPGFLHRPGLL